MLEVEFEVKAIIIKMAVLKFTDMLLLILITEMTSASNYHCENQPGYLMNCTSDNSRIRINKDRDCYMLSLCSNNTCIGNWTIECDAVCQACQSFLRSSKIKINNNCVYMSVLMHDITLFRLWFQ